MSKARISSKIQIDGRKIAAEVDKWADKHIVKAAEPDPAMTVIPNVTLCEVGQWEASTGTTTFTPDDLKSMIAAVDDPAVKSPRLRFGHTSFDTTWVGSQGGFDEQPCVGKFTNLRLGENDNSLVGDLVGVPAWLAEILPIAYPNRSVEVFWDVTTPTGTKHDAVLASVAVLGVHLPAVATLEDLAALFSVDGPDGVEVLQVGERVAAKLGDGRQRVAASVQYEDVRRSFYNDFATEESGRYWWWLQQVYVDPPLLIAADEEDNLWAITYSTKGDEVEFGEPQEVKQQYADPSGKVLARKGGAGKTYDQAESRPEDRTRPKEVKAMDPKLIREKLGLAEDATDEDVFAKLDELHDEPEPEEEEPAAEAAPEAEEKPSNTPDPALATIDPEALLQLRADAEAGREARERQKREDRDSYLSKAVSKGKFPPSRTKHWQTLWDQDPEGTRATIESLAEGLIPVDERGTSRTSDGNQADNDYPGEWLNPGERSRVKAAAEGKLETPRVLIGKD